MTNVEIIDRTLCRTSDGETFDNRLKAEAHQAELDIREMLSENDYVGDEQDMIMEAFRRVGIYIPPQLWADLRK